MKKIFQLIVFGFILSTSYAQEKDFFVKKSGDTVRCTINRVSEGYLFYSVMNSRTRIEIEKIADYSLSQEQSIKEVAIRQDVIYEAKEKNELKTQNREIGKTYSRESDWIRVSLNLGLAYRIGSEYDLPKNYIHRLRSGIQYSAKVQMFDSRDRGLGFEFNQFLSSARDDIPPYGDVQDNITINYFGISYIKRKKIIDNIGHIECGLGALYYKNEAFVNRNSYLYDGFTFCANIQSSYDIPISKSLNFSLNSGIIIGKFNSFEVNGRTQTVQNPEDGEGLVRINAGVGLSYSK